MKSSGGQVVEDPGVSWREGGGPSQADLQYIREIGAYYDLSTPAYLKSVGTTLQTGLVENGVEPATSNAAAARASNLYCAAAAGIKPEDRVLDAGCGVCGPSIDIAEAIPGVKIDGVTLSVVQALVGARLVEQAGLQDAITVSVADYHRLPFEEERYDVAIFLETAGYSYDLQGLFSGIRRVLKPGGTLYIKDVFCREGTLTPGERADLEQFDRIYAFRATTMSRVASVLSAAGFREVSTRHLGVHDGSYTDAGQVAIGDRFYKAMMQTVDGRSTLTDFGKLHAYNFSQLPVVFGEVVARKAR